MSTVIISGTYEAGEYAAKQHNLEGARIVTSLRRAIGLRPQKLYITGPPTPDRNEAEGYFLRLGIEAEFLP